MGPDHRRLNDYLRQQQTKTFQLGEHDCFTFTNGAWAAMYGEGYADKIIGRYACAGPKRLKQLLLDEYGHETIEGCLDAHMTRIDGIPPRGSLVITSAVGRWITGRALGIANGVRAVFIADKGVVHLPIDKIEGAWVR